MNIQTKLRLDRITVYYERTRNALDKDNLPAAMADLAELAEQSRRFYNFLVELHARSSLKSEAIDREKTKAAKRASKQEDSSGPRPGESTANSPEAK